MKQQSRRRTSSKVSKSNGNNGSQQKSPNSLPHAQSNQSTDADREKPSSSRPRDSNGQLKEQEIVSKITTLIDHGRALGLSPEEIRAYVDPPIRTGSVSRLVPKFHLYKAHFWALYRRGLLWPSLMSKVSHSPLRWRLCFQLPALLVIFFAAYRVAIATFPSVSEEECLIEKGPVLDELVRPVFPCEICQNLTAVPEVRNITREQFLFSYGFSGLPVLVKGAAMHWKAVNNFSFEYFKNLYLNNSEALQVIDEQCQFFQYNTEFTSLREALTMNPERAAFAKDQRPWYIGWSNCDFKIGDVLRQQYERPYFLPVDAEGSAIDWIFMGGSGVGAGVHIDKVDLPSWQAQVSGTKTWSLIPSPECSSVCSDMQVTVHKGDILVVDTNAWYHSTFVHPGEISITIGSEYE